MHNTSTFQGNHGEMNNQVMGCSDGYAEYLKSRGYNAHVELYYQLGKHLQIGKHLQRSKK